MSEGLAFIANGSFSLVSFIVALSIIVFIHEFGHYIIAKANNVQIEKFVKSNSRLEKIRVWFNNKGMSK